MLRSMWDLPRPGLEPVSLALAGGSLTTAPPGKSPCHTTGPSSRVPTLPYSPCPFLLPHKSQLDPHFHLNPTSQLLTPSCSIPHLVSFFSSFIPLLTEDFKVFKRQGDPRHHVAFVSIVQGLITFKELVWDSRVEPPWLHPG